MAGAEARAVFLDRDGTLIHDAGYIRDPLQVRLLPGAASGLTRLHQAGFRLVMVSNQSGIGRGMITPAEAEAVHDRLVACLAEHGIQLDAAHYCPHLPEEGCACRKPSPALLLSAARELGIDPGRSWMIGDKESDVAAGRQAGCRTVLLAGRESRPASGSAADYRAAGWEQVVEHILAQERTSA